MKNMENTKDIEKQNTELKDQVQNLLDRQLDDKSKIDEIEKINKELTEKIEANQPHLIHAESEKIAHQNNVEIQQLKSQVSNLISLKAKVEGDLIKAKDKISSLELKVESQKKSVSEKTAEIVDGVNEIKKLNKVLKSQEKIISNKDGEINQLNFELNKLRKFVAGADEKNPEDIKPLDLVTPIIKDHKDCEYGYNCRVISVNGDMMTVTNYDKKGIDGEIEVMIKDFRKLSFK